jgi:hypothetical protein
LSTLFDQLRKLNLPEGDFAVFGSGPLIVRGIIPAANDVDVICRGQAWEAVKELGSSEYLSQFDVTIVSLYDGRLTFGTEWGIGKFDTDALIDGAEDIEGLPFVRLEHVENYKKLSRRPKDLRHLEALRAYRSAMANKR